MLIRILLVFMISLLSLSTATMAQSTDKTAPHLQEEEERKERRIPSKADKQRYADSKAKLQRNLQRNSISRYNPNMSQRAFSEIMKDAAKDVFVINSYELQFNSNLSMAGSKSLATISLHSSGKKFGEIIFFGMNEIVEAVQAKMGEMKSLEESGRPVKLAYHIDMLPNILAFLKSSNSVAVVLDKTTSQISLSSGKTNMWERR